jgi:ribosomal protein S18 acetylase RimI-like enzyme
VIDVRTFTPADFERYENFGDILEEGATRPEWAFIAESGGEELARAGFVSQEPPAGAPIEVYLFGLSVDWDRPLAVEAARELLTKALPAVAYVGAPVDARTNPAVHSDYEERRALFDAAGMGLFQEKQGHYWQAGVGAMPLASGRLTFKSYADLPRHEFLAVLSLGPAGTLDRNDRYYYELTGPVGWAKVMEGFLGPGDEASWKVGYDPTGQPVGYVMLSAFDEDDTGTIAHIGVVPDARGNGYVNDLLAEATADAVRRGFTSILSDTDVLNTPMIAAFERAGHRAGVRPWHVWHYRYPPPAR